jgi:DNA-binding PadR family transcriptional regulator
MLHSQNLLLVLAALSRPPRESEALSRKTGLTVLEVDLVLKSALKHGWVDSRYRLTDSGHAELARARKRPKASPPLAEAVPFYYPKALRAPRGASS